MGVSTHLGGAERSLFDFLKFYRSQIADKNQMIVLLPKAEGPFIELLKQHDIPYEVLAFPDSLLKISRDNPLSALKALTWGARDLVNYVARLRRWLIAQQITVIHSTGLKCHLILTALSPQVSPQIYIHFRDIFESRTLNAYFNLFKRSKNIHWLAASSAIAKSLPSLSPSVLYDGFDESVFFPKKDGTWKKSLGLSDETPLLGIVGILTPWKGQKIFIEAAARIASRFPQAHFAVIGDRIYDTQADDGYADELHRRVREVGLTSRFHFTGFQKETSPIYNSLTWLVHASTQPEPFGRVVVESLLCKTPVIASRGGGVLEIVTDGVSGLLHTPGDVDDLTKTLEKALTLSSVEREKMAVSGYDFCKRSYSLKERCLELKQLLEKII